MAIIQRTRAALQPKNNGSVGIARSGIDETLPRATRQYENALAVDGFPVLYYRRRTTGIRCTCVGGQASATADMVPGLEPGINVLDPRGAGTTNYVNSMVQGTVFSIDRYGSRNNQYDANGGDNPQRTVPHSPLHQSLEIHNKATNMDDGFAEQIDPGTAEDLFDQEPTTAGSSQLTCAVCLGTGFVGGYVPSNAYRAVYDVQAPWSGDITLNATTEPHSWTLLGRRVQIDIMLPAGAVGLEAFRVWNNRDPLTVNSWFETDAGPVTIGAGIGTLCDGLMHRLVIEFPENVTAFTHFEIQLELDVAPVYAAWSRLAYSENLSVPENLDSPTITLSPSLPAVSLYDIVTESVYRRIWKITISNPAFDRERQITGWEATCRLLQAYEIQALLPKRHDRVWYWGNTAAQQPRNVAGTLAYNPYDARHQTKLR